MKKTLSLALLLAASLGLAACDKKEDTSDSGVPATPPPVTAPEATPAPSAPAPATPDTAPAPAEQEKDQ